MTGQAPAAHIEHLLRELAPQVLAAVELGRRSVTRSGRDRVQVTSPRTVAEYLMPQYGNRRVEQFGVLLLDTKHRVIRVRVLSMALAIFFSGMMLPLVLFPGWLGTLARALPWASLATSVVTVRVAGSRARLSLSFWPTTQL